MEAATALGALIVSILAAIIAARSARASEKSADVAVRALHRGAVRELIAACHGVLEENLRIQSRADELRPLYRTLAIFSGAVGGSVEQELTSRLDGDVTLAADRCKEAGSVLAAPTRLVEASDDDLDNTQVRIESTRLELQNIRERLQRAQADIAKQIEEHRQRQIR